MCKNCGQLVKRINQRGPLPDYCSIECRPKKNRPILVEQNTCAFCNVSFFRLKFGRSAKYCSQRCRWDANEKMKLDLRIRARTNLICAYCSKSFTGQRNDQKYCSAKCRHIVCGKTKNPIGSQMNCVKCGSVFIKRSSRHMFCSKTCMRSGVHSNYRERAKKFNVEYDADVTLRRAIERMGKICDECQLEITGEHMKVYPFTPNPDGPSLDHVIPMSAGGGHVWSNVVVVHFKCNVKRWQDSRKAMTDAG